MSASYKLGIFLCTYRCWLFDLHNSVKINCYLHLYTLRFAELLCERAFAQNEAMTPRAKNILLQCCTVCIEPWPMSRFSPHLPLTHTQIVTQAARVKSTVVSVRAGSPCFLPPQCHHLPYQTELPILMDESSSYSCWVNFLFKGSLLYVQHEGYLTPHLWMFCWPVLEFELSSLCQCLTSSLDLKNTNSPLTKM